MRTVDQVLSAELARFLEGRVERPEGCESSHPRPCGAGSTSVRRTSHRGRMIEIRTTYQVRIDGRPLEAHVSVHPGGRVLSQLLPNHTFYSALDMARAWIDTPGEEETADELNEVLEPRRLRERDREGPR